MQSLRAPRPTSIAVAIATFLALVAQILTSSPAAAHDGGWGWRNYPGSGHRLLWVYYDNNCSPYDFEVAVNSAAYNWTATYTPLEFSLASNSGCTTHWQY